MNSRNVVYKCKYGFNMIDQMQNFMQMTNFMKESCEERIKEHICMVDVCVEYYT